MTNIICIVPFLSTYSQWYLLITRSVDIWSRLSDNFELGNYLLYSGSGWSRLALWLCGGQLPGVFYATRVFLSSVHLDHWFYHTGEMPVCNSATKGKNLKKTYSHMYLLQCVPFPILQQYAHTTIFLKLWKMSWTGLQTVFTGLLFHSSTQKH